MPFEFFESYNPTISLSYILDKKNIYIYYGCPETAAQALDSHISKATSRNKMDETPWCLARAHEWPSNYRFYISETNKFTFLLIDQQHAPKGTYMY